MPEVKLGTMTDSNQRHYFINRVSLVLTVPSIQLIGGFTHGLCKL